MKITIESRPDTDAIIKERKEYYSKFENLIFMECNDCREKPGSPTLCQGCIHNRYVINMLIERCKK